MSKTYRALAIVAVIVTAVSLAADFTFQPGRVGGWFSYAPLVSTPSGLISMLFDGIWLTTTTIATPIIATFGAVVAAQGRHWVWLGVFIALGLFGLYGGSALYLLEIYLGVAALTLRQLAFGNLLPVILQALPAIAALLFVATTSRPARMHSDQASEAAV